MTLYCPTCTAVMKPLFSSYFCPYDCDRKRDADRPLFAQSWLWQQVSAGCRQLSCPICLGDGRELVALVCGPEENSYYGATCKDDSCHQINVFNDEGR